MTRTFYLGRQVLYQDYAFERKLVLVLHVKFGRTDFFFINHPRKPDFFSSITQENLIFFSSITQENLIFPHCC